MIKLMKYEIKKHFLKLPVALIILLFLIINCFKIIDTYREKSILSDDNLGAYKSVYWECYKEFGGKITNEKIEKLMSIYRPALEKIADRTLSTDYDKTSYTYNAYSDEIFFRWCFVDEMKYDYYYKNYAEKLVSEAKQNLEFYQSVGNQYKYRESYQIAEKFVGRKINAFRYTEKYLYYVQYDFSLLLILLICIYSLANMFIVEKEAEMANLLLTLKNGRKIVAAKVMTSFAFTAVVCALFWIEDFVVYSCAFRNFGGNSSPLYALEIFKNTALNVNLLQYSVISAWVKAFGMMIMCMIILLFSSMLRNTLYSYVSSFVTVVSLIYLHDLELGGSRLLQIVNPINLLVNRGIFKCYKLYNIMGYPVSEFALSMLCGGLLLLLLYIGITKTTYANLPIDRIFRGGRQNGSH